MEARAAAIAAGTRAGAGLAARAPAALHRRHQRQAGGPDRGALPGALDRPRRPVHLSRARPARGLRDARPQAPRRRRAPLRGDAGGMDHPHARGLRRARRAARGPRRRLGAPARQGRRPRGQDRRHRHPGQALGQPARHRAQRRAGPLAFLRHRALRRRRAALRRHEPRRSRPRGDARRRSTRCCGANSSRCSGRPWWIRPPPTASFRACPRYSGAPASRRRSHSRPRGRHGHARSFPGAAVRAARPCA